MLFQWCSRIFSKWRNHNLNILLPVKVRSDFDYRDIAWNVKGGGWVFSEYSSEESPPSPNPLPKRERTSERRD
jgi:hypothetical protein